MSNKTEFKNVELVAIEMKDKFTILKIKDSRTYQGKTTDHEFDILCGHIADLPELNAGDKLIIEGSITSKRNEKGYLSYSFWAQKIYKLANSEVKQKMSDKADDKSDNYDLPF